MRVKQRVFGRWFALGCSGALALAVAGCSGAGDDGAGGPGGAAGGGLGAGSSGTGGAGRGGAGVGSGSGGTSSAGAGAGTGGGGGGSSAGSGGIGAGGVGGAGSSAAGAGGQARAMDPCAGLPASCIELCEGGNCSCNCSQAEPCPAAMPTAGAPCDTIQKCGYGEPACHQVFECFFSKWKKVADTCEQEPVGTCPATLAEAMATPCLGMTCGYDGSLCQCGQSACSGVAMEPSTYCTSPPLALCQDPYPVDGAACPVEGGRCGSTCCGQQLNCIGGKWTTLFVPCPP